MTNQPKEELIKRLAQPDLLSFLQAVNLVVLAVEHNADLKQIVTAEELNSFKRLLEIHNP